MSKSFNILNISAGFSIMEDEADEKFQDLDEGPEFTKMWETSGWTEAMQVYQRERPLDMEWYDGGMTVEQQDKDAP
jgi:hypothetical protein